MKRVKPTTTGKAVISPCKYQSSGRRNFRNGHIDTAIDTTQIWNGAFRMATPRKIDIQVITGLRRSRSTTRISDPKSKVPGKKQAS